MNSVLKLIKLRLQTTNSTETSISDDNVCLCTVLVRYVRRKLISRSVSSSIYDNHNEHNIMYVTVQLIKGGRASESDAVLGWWKNQQQNNNNVCSRE